jgi:hypothetical protein
MVKYTSSVLLIAALCSRASAFVPSRSIGLSRPALNINDVALVPTHKTSTSLSMVLDSAMKSRLDGIRRSFQALTERLADPDVIADSNLLRQVMKVRSQSEETVQAFDEVRSSSSIL